MKEPWKAFASHDDKISFETWLEDYTDALLQFTTEFRDGIKDGSKAYPQSAPAEYYDAALAKFLEKDSI